MPLPDEFNTFQLKAKYVNFLGVPGEGQVRFTPTAAVIKAIPSDTMIFAATVTANLSQDGGMLITVPITDDPDMVPHFQYDVVEELKGAPRRTYRIEVPAVMVRDYQLNDRGPIDLSDLVPVGTLPTGSTALTRVVADSLYILKGTAEDPGAALGSWAAIMTLSDFPTVFPPAIGTSGTEAVAGNDPRLADQRIPTNGSVTDEKVANGAGINADKLAESTTRKLMTAAERTKLGTVATGATANSADSVLLNRANHTGSAPMANTVSDYIEAIQDVVATMFGLGNVTTTYDDATGKLTLTAPAGTGTGTADPESIRDTIGAAMVGVGLITVSVNDAADTITISTTATANSTDAFLLARANHTGQQAQSTVTNLEGDLALRAFKAEMVLRVRQNADGTWPYTSRPVGYKEIELVRNANAPASDDPTWLNDDEFVLEPR